MRAVNDLLGTRKALCWTLRSSICILNRSIICKNRERCWFASIHTLTELKYFHTDLTKAWPTDDRDGKLLKILTLRVIFNQPWSVIWKSLLKCKSLQRDSHTNCLKHLYNMIRKPPICVTNLSTLIKIF